MSFLWWDHLCQDVLWYSWCDWLAEIDVSWGHCPIGFGLLLPGLQGPALWATVHEESHTFLVLCLQMCAPVIPLQGIPGHTFHTEEQENPMYILVCACRCVSQIFLCRGSEGMLFVLQSKGICLPYSMKHTLEPLWGSTQGTHLAGMEQGTRRIPWGTPGSGPGTQGI